jgi:hypothetical protein
VAREFDGSDGVTRIVCPVHGAAHDDRSGDLALPPGQVNWAGLPINLDLAFSREQRDKVYVQHLMRKRGAQQWRWLQDGQQVCVCGKAAGPERLRPDAAESVSTR